MFAVACSWGRLGLPDGLIAAGEQRHGIHGGQIETSLMMRLRPDLVRTEQLRNYPSAWIAQQDRFAILDPEGSVGFGWETQDLNRFGALGDASIATPELGEAILAHTAARLVTLIGEMRAFDVDAWLREVPAASGHD
jgi:creatinine amidohydrolase